MWFAPGPPGAAAPMTLGAVPGDPTLIPCPPFGSGAIPESSTPTALPWTVMPSASRSMPIELPETRLPSPAPVPPMTNPGPPPLMPAPPLPSAAVPFTSVPMRFDWIVTSMAASTRIPLTRFPEIRFSPPGPPISTPVPDPPSRRMPMSFGRATVPVTSVPM